jgi:DNA (cytosine-5)-methyltransferase 1
MTKTETTCRPSVQVADLFAGAGGLSLGFQAAGCEIAAGIDIDAVAAETFRRNFAHLQPARQPLVLAGEEYSLEDVGFLRRLELASPDILIGGPPCQAFSRLGRGKLDSLSEEGFEGDPRNELYRGFLAMLSHWRPRAVVMENVPGMLSVKGVNYAERVARELAAVGYRVGYAVLNAVWYGVPQFRERLFFLGYRNDLGIGPVAPPGTHRVALPEGYRRPQGEQQPTLFDGDGWQDHEGELPVRFIPNPLPAVAVGDALDDLPPLTDHLAGTGLPRGDFRQPAGYRCPPGSDYARLMRTWPGFPTPTGVIDHVVRRTPRDYETFRLMQPGDRYPEAYRIAWELFEEELSRLRGAGKAPEEGTDAWTALRARFVPPYPVTMFEDKWRKLIPDQPSWTVPAHLAKDSYSHIHHDSSQARMISVREAARIQSFPDSFLFAGNMGSCFRQIGNAVPPLLAWAIAACVLRRLGFDAVPPPGPPVPSLGDQDDFRPARDGDSAAAT